MDEVVKRLASKYDAIYVPMREAHNNAQKAIAVEYLSRGLRPFYGRPAGRGTGKMFTEYSA